MRGAMVLAFDTDKLAGERTLFETTQVSLQHVMLSGLGRMVTGLLDEVRATGAVTKLALYDREGRVYHDSFATPVPPPTVAQVLASGRSVAVPASKDRPDYVFALPLVNEKRCQSCHGPDRPLRGAIEVTLDARRATAEVRRLEMLSTATAAGTILVVGGLIIFFLRRFVLHPVSRIGEIADRVGQGKLDSRVDVSSDDEVGRLGRRVNQMIDGLRQKLELSKFVSKETLKNVESQPGVIARGGVRKRVTMVFSDVRGFTAFSETREPEAVVEMLNRYLHAQSEVVAKFGGDIDKFVGDELMARFEGTDQDARATRCAVEMVRAVAALNEGTHAPVQIGVGVHGGEVVLGAMGAADRMDFTVIGDAVNLAARLCSAAVPGAVLVSAAVKDAASPLPDVSFEALEPIQVKGKKDPIAIYRAVRRSAGEAGSPKPA
jgi:adenylate cyclase